MNFVQCCGAAQTQSNWYSGREIKFILLLFRLQVSALNTEEGEKEEGVRLKEGKFEGKIRFCNAALCSRAVAL